MADWARRIKQRREALGMSVAGLARACGIRPPSIHNWEGGRTKAIEGKNLVAAARALGVSPEWILTGQGQLTAAAAITSTEIVTIRPRSNTPAVLDAPPIDPHRLARAIAAAADAFQRAGRVPSHANLAELAAQIYRHVDAGLARADSRRAADAELQRILAAIESTPVKE